MALVTGVRRGVMQNAVGIVVSVEVAGVYGPLRYKGMVWENQTSAARRLAFVKSTCWLSMARAVEMGASAAGKI